MQKSTVFVLAAASAVALSSCKKLGKLTADNFTVTPTPLEAVAGQVPATINGTFPEKYMKKKAQVTVTPVLRYEGGEVAAESATFQGEKVQGNGTEILYKVGGNYTMRATFPYSDAMMMSDLYATFQAKVGKKTVKVPEVKIGYGVVSTSQLLGNCLAGSNGAYAPDAYQRVVEQKEEASIKFLINQANLRASELKSTSLKDLTKILREINDNSETRALQGLEVSAYASPDGSYSLNEKLAEKRQHTGTDYLKGELKKINMKANIDTKFTAEDWEGFQQLVSQSNLQDKDIILRVLSMYSDPEQREEQIKNMSAVYTDIKDGILPELRRARLIVRYDVIGRSDEQILEQFAKDASQLSVEEELYGAKLVPAAQKKQWYDQIVKQYPNDYRALNNLAQMAYQSGDLQKAQNYLAEAQKVSASAPEVNTNLALMSLLKGDVQKAETYLAQGSGADAFNEILGALNLAKGNYAQAAKNLNGTNSNVAGLAQILANDYAAAKKTLGNVKNADATTAYLQAVLAARTNDTNTLSKALTSAIQQDKSYATRALKDLEFSKYTSIVSSLVK